jgi:hypothetical protein
LTVAAIIKSKILKTLTTNPVVVESMYTVGVGKKAAVNLSVFNPTAASQEVFLALKGLDISVNDLMISGAAFQTSRIAARKDLLRVYGTGGTAFLITADYKQVSHNGGTSFTGVDPSVFFGYAGHDTYYLRITYISANEIWIHVMNVSNGTYVSEANPFVLAETGIGTRLLANPKYFCERMMIDSGTNMTCWFPNASGLISRYRSSAVVSSTAINKTIILADDDVANIPAATAVPTQNNSSGYSGILDLAAADYNYNYYTTAADTVPDKIVGSNGILNAGTTASKVVLTQSHALVMTADNRFMWITRIPSTTSAPTYGGLNNMPINTADVLSCVVHVGGSRVILFAANGLVYEANPGGTTMPQITTAVTQGAITEGLHYDGETATLYASENSYPAYFGTTYGSSSYFANTANFGVLPGLFVNGTNYRYVETLEDIIVTERHVVPANGSIEISGRLYPSETEFVLITRSVDGSKLLATVNALES